MKRIVNAARKTEKPAPATPSTAEIASGTHCADVLRPLLHVLRGPGVAERRELVRLRSCSTSDGRAWRKSRTRSDDPHEEEQPEQRHGDAWRRAR